MFVAQRFFALAQSWWDERNACNDATVDGIANAAGGISVAPAAGVRATIARHPSRADKRNLIAAALSCVLCGIARGQGGGRQIPLPDTAGANFSIADSASKVGSTADYDALIGVWQFRFQQRRPDGSFDPAFSGHWTFEKKPGDLLIEDRWRADDPSVSMGVGTYTYRVFDPQRKIWQFLGTRSTGGEFALGLSWSDGNNRYAIQHYGSDIMRIRYFKIEPNQFLWRADRTPDGGKTWLLDAWTMEARRIGK